MFRFVLKKGKKHQYTEGGNKSKESVRIRTFVE